MNWALVTVQHSGTRFVREKLRPHFATVGIPLTHDPKTYLYSILYQHHCNRNALPHLEARRRDGVKVITTDRPREHIAASWLRRYGGARRLESVYDNWLEFIEPTADVIIKLDGTENEQLNAFIERLKDGECNNPL